MDLSYSSFQALQILCQLHKAKMLTITDPALYVLPIPITASLQAPGDASSHSLGTPRSGTNQAAVDPKPISPLVRGPARPRAFV